MVTAQPLKTAGEELDYLDHDLSDLSVQSVQCMEATKIQVPTWSLVVAAATKEHHGKFFIRPFNLTKKTVYWGTARQLHHLALHYSGKN